MQGGVDQYMATQWIAKAATSRCYEGAHSASCTPHACVSTLLLVLMRLFFTHGNYCLTQYGCPVRAIRVVLRSYVRSQADVFQCNTVLSLKKT